MLSRVNQPWKLHTYVWLMCVDWKRKVLKTQAEDWGLDLLKNRGPLPIPVHVQSGLPHLNVYPLLALGQCDQNCVGIGPRVPGCGVSPMEMEVVFWAPFSPTVRTWAGGLAPARLSVLI